MNKILNYLWKPRRKFALWVASTSVVVLFLGMHLPLAFFLGQGTFWNLAPHDLQVQLSGFFYFIQEPWQWPLFSVQNLAFPQGTNIIFTDSLPILALFTKIFHAFLPTSFHPFGLYYGLCLLLQAWIINAILQQQNIRGFLPIIAICALTLLTPALLFRFQHIALCSHFLILTSIWIYLRGMSETHQSLKWLMAFMAIMALGLWIHFYMFIMTGVFFTALVLHYLFHGVERKKTALATLGIAIFLTLLMYASGYFSTKTSAMGDSRGFGLYSMNLLSPIWPQKSFLFQQGVLDPTGGQFEGMNYFGAGILFLFLCNLLFKSSGLKKAIAKHRFLLGLLILTVIVSISDTIYVYRWKVWSFQYPIWLDYLFEHVRSSGRFFWCVTYSALVFFCLRTCSHFSRAVASFILIIALLLQVIDTLPIRKDLKNYFAGQSDKEFYSWHRTRSEILQIADSIQYANMVLAFPNYTCSKDEQYQVTLRFLQWQTALRNIPINSAFVNSKNTIGCGKFQTQPFQMQLQPGVIYYFEPRIFDLFEPAAHLKKSELCRKVSGAWACRVTNGAGEVAL